MINATTNSSMKELEGSLLNIFKPVNPTNEYVSGLRNKLFSQPEVVVERRNQAAALLAIVFGLLLGIVVLLKLFKS